MTSLTQREQEVLGHLLRGETNKEIAAAFGCTVKAIEYHVRNLLRKAQVPSRTKLIASRIRVGPWTSTEGVGSTPKA